MEAIHVLHTIETDGQIRLVGLPVKRGQSVEVIVLRQPSAQALESRDRLTVGDMRRSGLIGMWQERDDIGDSSNYSRRLREQAQQHEVVSNPGKLVAE